MYAVSIPREWTPELQRAGVQMIHGEYGAVALFEDTENGVLYQSPHRNAGGIGFTLWRRHVTTDHLPNVGETITIGSGVFLCYAQVIRLAPSNVRHAAVAVCQDGPRQWAMSASDLRNGSFGELLTKNCGMWDE